MSWKCCTFGGYFDLKPHKKCLAGQIIVQGRQKYQNWRKIDFLDYEQFLVIHPVCWDGFLAKTGEGKIHEKKRNGKSIWVESQIKILGNAMLMADVVSTLRYRAAAHGK